MLPLAPSLGRDEEAVLDGIARDPRLALGVCGPVEREALRRLAARRRGVSASGARRE